MRPSPWQLDRVDVAVVVAFLLFVVFRGLL
jgi:hypothetical protein